MDYRLWGVFGIMYWIHLQAHQHIFWLAIFWVALSDRDDTVTMVVDN